MSHFHWQNLNEKRGGRVGSPLRNGRAWWHFFDHRALITWEWVLGSRSCRLGVTVGGDEEFGVGFTLAVPFLFAFYLTVAGFRPVVWFARLLLPKTEERYGGEHGYRCTREVYFSVHDWALWWTIWRHPMAGWSRRVSRWRDGSWHFRDQVLNLLLGKHQHSERDVINASTMIPMPEGSYPATVRIYENTWKRPRWFARHMLSFDVKIPDGVPFPGKGENSWDCGQDATYGLSGPAEQPTVEHAVSQVVETVLRSRRRYGGSVDWRPAVQEAS